MAITNQPTQPARQSSSASRYTDGGAEFFILSQSGERPERYIESFRFDTIPSSPILQAWAKTVGPSPSICSLNWMPGRALATIDGSLGAATEIDMIHVRRAAEHDSPAFEVI